jgi:guanine deaminase
MSPSETRTIFYGPLVNTESLSSFQALPRCLLALGSSGHIDWIEEDVHESALQNVLAQHASLEVPLVSLRHGEFILPGFVDTHTVRILLTEAVHNSIMADDT